MAVDLTKIDPNVKQGITEDQLLKIVKHFKAIFNCEKFVLTGSQALRLMGINVNIANSDIDIKLYNPSQETVEMVKKLQEEFPAKTKQNYPEATGGIFMFDGVKVDVFFCRPTSCEGFECTNITWEGIDLSLISRIISAKKTYNRPKDWFQLRNIARFFFKEEEFQNYLNKQ